MQEKKSRKNVWKSVASELRFIKDSMQYITQFNLFIKTFIKKS